MNKFEELFSVYDCQKTDAEVKKTVENILSAEYVENNNVQVYGQCLGMVDLTSLNVSDTESDIAKLTEKVNDFSTVYPALANVAAICVFPALVPVVKDVLTENVEIAAVAGGFPASQTFLEIKVAETAMAAMEGASEIDVVLSVGKFLEGNYEEVYEELREIKSSCRDARLKVILETGALKSASNIMKASILAMAAGADFIKTSTGKISVSATPEATYLMCYAIKQWNEKNNEKVGFKAAGGIVTTEDAVKQYTIVKNVLGKEWLDKELFRIGASRLANNLLTAITGKETKYF